MSIFSKLFRKKPALDWRAFTEHFADRARERGYSVEIHWGEDLGRSSISFSRADDNAYTAYLDAVWQEYQNEPGALDALIDARLDVLDQMTESTAAPDASQIFPNVKADAWLEAAKAMRRDGGADPDEILSQPLAGDIHLVYMLDAGNAFRDMHRSELGELGIADEAALHDTAFTNLRQYAASRIETEAYDGGIHRLVLDGFLDAALLLILPQIIDSADFPHGIIAAVPARDALIFCDADNNAAIRNLQEITAELFAAAPYAVSAYLYHLHDGTIRLHAPH